MALTIEEMRVLYDADFSRYEAGARRFREGVDRDERHVVSRFNSMATAATASFAAIGGTAAVAAVARYGTAYTSLQNTLRLVIKDQSELNATLDELFAVAQRSKQPIDAVADTFQKVKISTDEMNLSSAEQIRLTETISKLAPGADAAIRQLGQALGAGALRGDEFVSVMEGAPTIARAIADSLGVPIGKLRELASDGKLTSDVVINALRGAADQADELAKRYETTIPEALTNLDTAFVEYIGQVDDSLGATAALATGIESLTNNLDTVGDAFTVISAALLGRATPTIVGMGAAALTGGMRVAVLSRAVSILGVQATASAVATRGWTAALAFFGGPIGLAVTALAGGIAYLAVRTSEAEKEAVRHKDALQDIHDLNAELAGSTDDVAASLDGERVSLLSNTREQLENAKARLKLREEVESGKGLFGSLQIFASLSDATGITSSVSDMRGEVANLEAEIAAIESRAVAPSAPTTSATTPPTSSASDGKSKDLERQAQAAAKLKTEIELLGREWERWQTIAKERGVEIGDTSDLNAQQIREMQAEIATRLDRAGTNAGEGLAEGEKQAEILRIRLERVREQVGLLTDAEAARLDKDRQAAQERDATIAATDQALIALLPTYERLERQAEAWRLEQLAALSPDDVNERARVEEAFAGKMASINAARVKALAEETAATLEKDRIAREVAERVAETARKEAEAEQAKRDAVMASIAALKQQMGDEIRIQSARSQGVEQEKEVRQQIDARRTAERLAAEAQKVGIDITREALQAEILVSKKALSAAEDRADAFERQRQTMERIAELQKGLALGGDLPASIGDIFGAASVDELDAILDSVQAANQERRRAAEIMDAEAGVRERIADAAASELPALEKELSLVRQVLEARHAQADADERSSEAARERRAEIERASAAERRIAESSEAAREAARKTEIEAVAAAAALDAKNLDDLERVLETRERQLVALERELTIKSAIADLGENATPEEIGAIRASAGNAFDTVQAEEIHNEVLERRQVILEEIDTANRRITEGIASAITQAESFEDALANIANQLLSIAAQGLFEGAFGSPNAGASGGGLGQAFAGVGESLFSGGSSATSGGGLLGGIFGGASLFAKGGIVDGPTPFAFDGGRLGIAGEAGSEGILPLRRGADGNLGVIATQSPAPNVEIIINRAGPDTTATARIKPSTQRSAMQGNRALSAGNKNR